MSLNGNGLTVFIPFACSFKVAESAFFSVVIQVSPFNPVILGVFDRETRSQRERNGSGFRIVGTEVKIIAVILKTVYDRFFVPRKLLRPVIGIVRKEERIGDPILRQRYRAESISQVVQFLTRFVKLVIDIAEIPVYVKGNRLMQPVNAVLQIGELVSSSRNSGSSSHACVR